MKQSEKERYLKILGMFIDVECERQWMRTPFNALGKTMSTDGSAMVIVPFIGDEYEIMDNKLSGIYPMNINKKQVNINK